MSLQLVRVLLLCEGTQKADGVGGVEHTFQSQGLGERWPEADSAFSRLELLTEGAW